MHRLVIITATFAAITIAAWLALAIPLAAKEKEPQCAPEDRACVMRQIEFLAPKAGRGKVKDGAYKDLAAAYIRDDRPDSALALLDEIEDPDIMGQTVKTIGMEAIARRWSKSRYDYLFTALARKAEKINHAPSRSVALINVVAVRAAANDDAGARKMATAIQNATVKRSALEEIAIVEAERGDKDNAFQTVAMIDPALHRDAVYKKISGILLDQGLRDDAYAAANLIGDKSIKITAIQKILGQTEKGASLDGKDKAP